MEHKSNQRKFRLDDVRTEITGNPNIVREYSFKKNNSEYTDKTFWWLLCGCDKYCSCNSESSGWTDPTCPSDGGCRRDRGDPDNCSCYTYTPG
ncbi:hypothetical protein J4465_02380 [Candidatus Pacearchaeota archaeon]|nr:hypothetical protein [Candidatus Pacearchaeota archaeon]